MTSSGWELSENPVKPRRSQNSAVISRRWLSSCFSVPDATIRSATCGGRKRRSLLIRSISPTCSMTRCSSCWLSFAISCERISSSSVRWLSSFRSRAFSIAHSLSSKIRDQLNLLVGERAYLLPIDANRANQFAFLEHWHVEKTSRATQFGCRDAKRLAVGVNLLGMCVDDMDSLLAGGDAAQASAWTGADRSSVQIFIVFGRHAQRRNRCVSAILKTEQNPDFGSANSSRVLQDRSEN